MNYKVIKTDILRDNNGDEVSRVYHVERKLSSNEVRAMYFRRKQRLKSLFVGLFVLVMFFFMLLYCTK